MLAQLAAAESRHRRVSLDVWFLIRRIQKIAGSLCQLLKRTFLTKTQVLYISMQGNTQYKGWRQPEKYEN